MSSSGIDAAKVGDRCDRNLATALHPRTVPETDWQSMAHSQLASMSASNHVYPVFVVDSTVHSPASTHEIVLFAAMGAASKARLVIARYLLLANGVNYWMAPNLAHLCPIGTI
jgi:hypothetical protein